MADGYEFEHGENIEEEETTEQEEEKEDLKQYRKPKPYLSRYKRHQDAVLSLYSPDGITG